MRRHFSIVAIITSGLIVASCQSSGPVAPSASVAPQPGPSAAVAPSASINGKWVPTDSAAAQVYYNEFKNGKFVSRSPDGAQTIAAGQYTVAENGDISLSWYSEARKANSTATCKKLSDSELQCTSGGSVFNLRRA